MRVRQLPLTGGRYRHDKRLTDRHGRVIVLGLTGVFIFSLLTDGLNNQRLAAQYDIQGLEGTLLSESLAQYANLLVPNPEDGSITFNEDYAHGAGYIGDRSQAQYSAWFGGPDQNFAIGVNDARNGVTLEMRPMFDVGAPQKNRNRVVYPVLGRNAVAVFTLEGTRVKEDLILFDYQGDELEFDYQLDLPEGTELRVESDGSLSVWGVNSIFLGNISTGSEEDEELVSKARENGEKNNLLFKIPAPFIVEPTKNSEANPTSWFSLPEGEKGAVVRIHAAGLGDAQYPLSIDPSIYIETARKLMRGNNETNIDFDTTNELINKGFTTGARFDDWDTTTQLNEARWNGASDVAGGFVYYAGGETAGAFTDTEYTTATSSATFSVPSGVTEVIVKAWGAGGGGGGAAPDRDGGNGGGGGYASSTITVTPLETLDVYVGGGGSGGTGGPSGTASGNGGGGGGFSAVFRSTTPLLMAAGGGGGGGGNGDTGSTARQPGDDGGAGGGTTGVTGDGNDTTTGGGGGTPTAGGAGGTVSGVAGTAHTGVGGGDGGSNGAPQANGGTNDGGDGGTQQNGGGPNKKPGGGGGGGGYYGAGGGGLADSQYNGGGGGGGGSSYTTGSPATNASGSGQDPGNKSDTDRGGAGDGAAGGSSGGNGSNGDDGKVIISYTTGSGDSVHTEVYWAEFNGSTGTIDSPNPGDGACVNWCTLAAYDLPDEREAHSMTAYNGFLYVMGGREEAGARQSTVWIAKLGANGEPQLWHPTDDDKSNWDYWHVDTALPEAINSHAAVAYNNTMYLVGGENGSGGVTTVRKAEITPTGELGTWTTTGTTSLDVDLFGHTVHAYNDYMYVIGGNDGGVLQNKVYYNKLDANGDMGAGWHETEAFDTARMTWGGKNTVIYGGYLYLSGGCSALTTGYCSTVESDTQLASINADGTITEWNTIEGLTNLMVGHSLTSWRGYIYRVGGCAAQSTSNGLCTDIIATNQYGTINPDGDASTVSDSVANGVGTCSGGDPYDCDTPPLGNSNGEGGQMAGGVVVNNGVVYYIGGCREVGGSGQICTNGAASRTADTIYYAEIANDGTLRRVPAAACPTGTSGYDYVGSWCVDNVDTINGSVGLAAFGYTVFNNVIYAIGGTDGQNWQTNVYRNPLNADGSLGTWTSQTQSSVGLGTTSIGYPFVFARANPSSAGTNPANLYVVGGCSNGSNSGLDCGGGTFLTSVYKCNITTTGALASCSTSGQVQLDAEPVTGGSQGLGIMAGTVYANYVYLIGGQSDNEAERGQVMYAKIDDSNNIIDVDDETIVDDIWETSGNEISPARRRGMAFGYNGYLYALAGFAVDTGLNDLLFAKIDVSDGSIGAFATSGVTVNQRWDLRGVVSSGYVYTLGGCSSGAPPATCNSMTDTVQTFQLYNNFSGSTSSYTSSASDFTTDRIGASSAVMDGFLYVAGGCISATDCTDATDNTQYAALGDDGSIGTWYDAGVLPEDRTWGQLEVVHDTLYYVGGQGDTSTDERAEVYYGPQGTGFLDPVQEQVATATCKETDGACTATATITAATADNLLIAVCSGEGSGAAASIGITGFTNATGETSSANMAQQVLYKVSTGGETSVACTVSEGVGQITGYLTVYEYSNMATVSPVDVTATNTGSSSSPSTGTTANTTQHVTVLIGGISMGEQNISFSSWTDSFTEDSDQQYANPGGGGVGVASRIANKLGTYSTSATPSSAADWAGQIVAFKAAVDPNSENVSWTEATEGLVAARTQHSADVWNGRIYVTGGNDSAGTATNTVYVSPDLSAGGDITAAWTSDADTFDVARSGMTTIAYANNLYVLGGFDGTNYLSDVQFTQINSDGTLDPWSFTTSLPQPVRNADGFARNGYMYLFGGRSASATCTDNTYISPISANTSISSGNNPTGIGQWYQTREAMDGGDRYGGAAAYSEGKAYVLGGGCDATLTLTGADRTLYATLFSQPQVARYSRMIDTDTDVFPNSWLMNGLDNDIGARWSATYESSTDTNNTWGERTNFGEVTLGDVEAYVPLNETYSTGTITQSGTTVTGVGTTFTEEMEGATLTYADGTSTTVSSYTSATSITVTDSKTVGSAESYTISNIDTEFARFYYFSLDIDSSRSYGYPDDVTRGPTIDDLSLFFTSDPNKRLRHGKTFTGGEQQPLDTPCRVDGASPGDPNYNCPLP